MKVRRGQVAIYLVLVLVALTFLMLMNVGAYLAVTAKNRAMNAGDSAALAAAGCQGRLLRQIGELNLEHLQLLGSEAGLDDVRLRRLAEIAAEQGRLAFLGPLEGIRLANEAAQKVGAKPCDGMSEILNTHVNDVRTVYAQTLELYPEPWDGAWEEYAVELGAAVVGGVIAGPDNIDFRNAAGGHLLKNGSFYAAVDGHAWCWFKNHADALAVLETYSSYRDWAPLPEADTTLVECANCEVFSLYLESKVGSALEVLGEELVIRLTGWSAEAIRRMPALEDRSQVWYFFDERHWGKWTEIDPDGAAQFPAVGRVKPEYDVKGCGAVCRVYENIPKLVAKSGEREIVWTAAAKPFATFTDSNGALSTITSANYFVVPAEWDVRLVPVDTVGGSDLSTADIRWVTHIQQHLPQYLINGPGGVVGCGYCNTLVEWERESLRWEGREWLRTKSDSCDRSTPGGAALSGGAAHGH